MKREDLINACVNLNELLSQLKDENAFLRQRNNKMVDDLIKSKQKNIETKPPQQQSRTTSTTNQNFLSKTYTKIGKDAYSLG